MNAEQYKIICARRIAFNQLMWQVPALATAGQGFLMAAAFNPLIEARIATVLAIFSLIVGAASLQLMAKHRHLEMTDSALLMDFEEHSDKEGYAVLHGPHKPHRAVPENWFVRIRSFRVWSVVIIGFCLLALFAAYTAHTRATPVLTNHARQKFQTETLPSLREPGVRPRGSDPRQNKSHPRGVAFALF